MSARARRATVSFDPKVHRALRLKAVATDRTMSDLVNEAVRISLSEDNVDLGAFASREAEPALRFEDFVKKLERRHRL